METQDSKEYYDRQDKWQAHLNALNADRQDLIMIAELADCMVSEMEWFSAIEYYLDNGMCEDCAVKAANGEDLDGGCGN